MKKVSIILPIYNVSQYLRECLDSVIGQTLQDIEILCVNDGSTDDSLDIIREYAARDPRIVVITGPNGGYGKAMNKGLDRATGEYIGIVEPDDYVVPEMFGELYSVAKEHDLVSLLFKLVVFLNCYFSFNCAYYILFIVESHIYDCFCCIM